MLLPLFIWRHYINSKLDRGRLARKVIETLTISMILLNGMFY